VRHGVALHLLGLAAFGLRITGELGLLAIVVAMALVALYAVGGSLPAWAVVAGIAALVGALCVSQSLIGARADEPATA
jgi:hypothetical protein